MGKGSKNKDKKYYLTLNKNILVDRDYISLSHIIFIYNILCWKTAYLIYLKFLTLFDVSIFHFTVCKAEQHPHYNNPHLLHHNINNWEIISHKNYK